MVDEAADIAAVRERFIELLRARTPDHPFVAQHDRKKAEAAGPTIDQLMATICADCPVVWQYSCACYGWCARTGAALPDPQ